MLKYILPIIGIIAAITLFNFAYSDTNTGLASWYGGGEKLNKHTANGEEFDSSDFTCASWDYPFNTLLKVTNVSTGQSVVVRVNDRGPNKRLGRAIDLTKRAFTEIGDIRKGLVTVKIDKVKD